VYQSAACLRLRKQSCVPVREWASQWIYASCELDGVSAGNRAAIAVHLLGIVPHTMGVRAKEALAGW
jgi:hypothetical protein